MKSSSILATAMVFATFMVSSCDPAPSNNVTPTTTVVQDKQAIADAMTELRSCVNGLQNGAFAQMAINFMGLSNGRIGNNSFTSSFSPLWNNTGLSSLDANRAFLWQNGKGVYTWQSGNLNRSLPSSNISAFFPSTPAQSSNNCTLTMSDYTDQSFVVNGLT